MRSSQKPVAQISRELDVAEQTLRNWRKQEEIDEGEREGITTEEREELSRLRKKVKVLEREKEVLRKATVDSTGRCNTVGFGCCSDRRCVSGEAGSTRGIVRGRQDLYYLLMGNVHCVLQKVLVHNFRAYLFSDLFTGRGVASRCSEG
jgi:transposase